MPKKYSIIGVIFTILGVFVVGLGSFQVIKTVQNNPEDPFVVGIGAMSGAWIIAGGLGTAATGAFLSYAARAVYELSRIADLEKASPPRTREEPRL